MGKLKNEMLSGLTQSELENVLYHRNDDIEIEYHQWLNSQEYIDMVNEELELTNPIYSFSDIQSALKYASESVTIYPEEVGKEVYDILIAEKVEEYLKNYKNELETIYR